MPRPSPPPTPRTKHHRCRSYIDWPGRHAARAGCAGLSACCRPRAARAMPTWIAARQARCRLAGPGAGRRKLTCADRGGAIKPDVARSCLPPAGARGGLVMPRRRAAALATPTRCAAWRAWAGPAGPGAGTRNADHAKARGGGVGHADLMCRMAAVKDWGGQKARS